MKLKHIGLLLTAIAATTACDDNTGSLGIGMLPSSDGLTANVATFNVKTESFYVDSVFAKTSVGYVGKFTDPEFGSYEASFLSELNCSENFYIPEVYHETEFDSNGKATKGDGLLYKDSVVSAKLVIYYSSWFGDSLNTCRMSAYELTRALDNNRYTNIDPEDYYDKNDDSKLLGRKAYSAYDTSVPDSVRNATDSDGYSTYYPNITFKLDSMEFGYKRILKEYRENPYKFQNANAFRDYVFKGLYLKNDLGDGTILYIDRIDIQMEFCCRYIDEDTGVALYKSDGTDSLYNTTQILFASTKEVIQSNRFENSDILKQKAENEKDWTYIKSPAGIFTEATLPYDEIYEQLTNDTLNAVRLTFTNYREKSNYEFSMSAPEQVLLIRKKDMRNFFEENELPDDVTSFTVSHNNVNLNQYTFQNIARLVTTCINEKQAAKQAAGSSWNEEEWLKQNADWDKVLLIPVTATYDDSNSYSGSSQLIGLQHDLKPGYAKLVGGPATVDNTEDGELKNPLKLEVVYTTFNE